MLAVVVAQFAFAGGFGSGSDSRRDDARIASLEHQVDRLSAEVSKKKKKAKPGPQGPAGPQGPQGQTGPAGSPASGMLFGWIPSAELPSNGSSKDFTPLGDGTASIGTQVATPNATTVIRDFSARSNAPPGIVGAKWVFVLQGASATQQLTCEIIGSFATSCNSGAQTATIPPGGNIRLIVERIGGPAPTELYYAYRAVSP